MDSWTLKLQSVVLNLSVHISTTWESTGAIDSVSGGNSCTTSGSFPLCSIETELAFLLPADDQRTQSWRNDLMMDISEWPAAELCFSLS